MDKYDRRTEKIFERAETCKRKRTKRIATAAASLSMCFVLAFGFVLFLPYPNGGLPDVTIYSGSEYYDLIRELNPLTRRGKAYKNNFEKWFSGVFGGNGATNDSIAAPDGSIGDSDDVSVAVPDGSGGGSDGSGGGDQNYEETTDNQVDGVIEGDLFKRSDRYIYYLSPQKTQRSDANETSYEFVLKIYSIDGEASAEISSFTVTAEADYRFYYHYVMRAEMYLSEDCRTVSIVTESYDTVSRKVLTAVIPLDVSDVNSVVRNETFYVSGSCVSSRSSSGEIILMSNFTVPYNPDFTDEKQYVPRSGTADNMTLFTPDEIVIPDGSGAARYTVVSLFDGKEITSRLAFLSFSASVYVDTEDVYLTQSYVRNIDNAKSESMTRIARIAYDGGELEYKGTAEIAGDVLNQYSMDTHEGVLRVVTTTRTYEATRSELYTYRMAVVQQSDMTSASLYCIDVDSFEIIADLENFAPIGETVRSVRFDGNTAYVCTAVVLTDPVFAIDLSDLTNITYKDTGTIDGYSFSLTKFADGTLLGIGYDGNRRLKIELYAETDAEVESLAAYVLDADHYTVFSEKYKAYMIDAENRLIGLCVQHSGYIDIWYEYLLVAFDGENLVEIGSYTVEASEYDTARATVIGDFVYILTDGGIVTVAL